MKEVAAELDAMRATVEQHVLVQLEVLIVSIGERGGIAEDTVETTRRDLRIAHVARIVRYALKADLAGEVHAAVCADLSSRDVHPAESKLVQEPARDVGVTDHGVSGLGVERASEAGHQCFLKAAAAERLHFVRIEGAHACEELIAGVEAVVETQAE